MPTNYRFPAKNSDDTASQYYNDIEDVFVKKEFFSDDTTYRWGSDISGSNLGISSSSPVAVTTDTRWRSLDISVSSSILGIKLDGTLWGWGSNNYGALGLNDIIHRSSPIQIGSSSDWKVAVTIDDHSSAAIKNDGSLWVWGHNSVGRLGLSDTIHRSSPVQVGSLTDWARISNTLWECCLIKSDGSLWVWGFNSNGQLGLNDGVHRSSPVQVGNNTDWKYVTRLTNATTALKRNGTLWTWGSANFGALGLGIHVGNIVTPTQVGTLKDWRYIANGYGMCYAIKNNGSLWSWGENTVGQLGLNDTIHRSSPVQVGSLTNWKYINACFNQGLAIKTDSTLWGWGRNNVGRLGLGDVTDRSSPTQVGSAANWKSVTIGAFSAYGIRIEEY